jgi:hypothetical protein
MPGGRGEPLRRGPWSPSRPPSSWPAERDAVGQQGRTADQHQRGQEDHPHRDVGPGEGDRCPDAGHGGRGHDLVILLGGDELPGFDGVLACGRPRWVQGDREGALAVGEDAGNLIPVEEDADRRLVGDEVLAGDRELIVTGTVDGGVRQGDPADLGVRLLRPRRTGDEGRRYGSQRNDE